MDLNKLMFWEKKDVKSPFMKISEKINYPCKYQEMTREQLDNILGGVAPFYKEISCNYVNTDKKEIEIKITFKIKTEKM